MVDAAALGFDPSDPSFLADPYPAYDRLRREAPVLFDERSNHWLISRHRDVSALLRDRRFGRSYRHVATHEEMGRAEEPEWQRPFWDVVRNGMLDLEPPNHTRLRSLVSKVFTPRRFESLRPAVRTIMDGLVDEVAGAGEFDLISAIAEPLPVAVIAELLGVPEKDRHLLRPWSADMVAMFELSPSDEPARRAVRAAEEFAGYLRGLARTRRQEPGDDLISALAQAAEPRDRLTEDELIGTCVLLLNAGHEATVNATGNGWLALLRHPDELERLRDDPSLVPSAVEELLRFDSPSPMFERWVLEDTTIDGHRVPKGSELALLLGSANRDPEAFDRAEQLDLSRRENPHVTFGAGIHFCLGAPLARLELQESLATLIRRLPNMAPVDLDEPRWKPSFVLRGLQELRITS
jgi:cytochrome P450